MNRFNNIRCVTYRYKFSCLQFVLSVWKRAQKSLFLTIIYLYFKFSLILFFFTLFTLYILSSLLYMGTTTYCKI
jgi:hypothetical protein